MDAEGRRELEEFNESPSHGSEIVFPNTVRDGGIAENFLWKGLPNPSPVQRIGAWILGLFAISCGLMFVALAIHELYGDDHPRIGFAAFMLVALVVCIFGALTFRLGFSKAQKPSLN